MTKKGGLDFDDSENARAKNFAKASSSLVKGAVIDMPMALADGLRHAPRMYGDKGRDYGQITGIKSGLSMAGKVRSVPIDVTDSKEADSMCRTLLLEFMTEFRVLSWIPLEEALKREQLGLRKDLVPA
jgi:hypothetical protein